jgi:hypothetical protein
MVDRMTVEEIERRTRPEMSARHRFCGANHVEGCAHQRYMRQGVEQFLASPTTRKALALCLARMPYPSVDPTAQATAILTELARTTEVLDA